LAPSWRAEKAFTYSWEFWSDQAVAGSGGDQPPVRYYELLDDPLRPLPLELVV
jgi:hypothetical protein